jgi:hypothetical protein
MGRVIKAKDSGFKRFSTVRIPTDLKKYRESPLWENLEKTKKEQDAKK